MKKLFFTNSKIEPDLKRIFPKSSVLSFRKVDKLKDGFSSDDNFLIINFDFCQTLKKEFSGHLFVVNKIICKNKNLIPEVLFSCNRENSIFSLLESKEKFSEDKFLDATSEVFFKSFSNKFPLERILILRLAIYDFGTDIKKILKEKAKEIKEEIKIFQDFCNKNLLNSKEFTEKEEEIIKKILKLGHFTFSMKKKLLHILKLKKASGEKIEDFFRDIQAIILNGKSGDKKSLAKKILKSFILKSNN